MLWKICPGLLEGPLVCQTPHGTLMQASVFTSAFLDFLKSRGKYEYEVTLLTGGSVRVGWMADPGAAPFNNKLGVGNFVSSVAIDTAGSLWDVKEVKYDFSVQPGDIITACASLGNHEYKFSFFINGKLHFEILQPPSCITESKHDTLFFRCPVVTLDKTQSCILNVGESKMLFHQEGFEVVNAGYASARKMFECDVKEELRKRREHHPTMPLLETFQLSAISVLRIDADRLLGIFCVFLRDQMLNFLSNSNNMDSLLRDATNNVLSPSEQVGELLLGLHNKLSETEFSFVISSVVLMEQHCHFHLSDRELSNRFLSVVLSSEYVRVSLLKNKCRCASILLNMFYHRPMSHLRDDCSDPSALFSFPTNGAVPHGVANFVSNARNNEQVARQFVRDVVHVKSCRNDFTQVLHHIIMYAVGSSVNRKLPYVFNSHSIKHRPATLRRLVTAIQCAISAEYRGAGSPGLKEMDAWVREWLPSEDFFCKATPTMFLRIRLDGTHEPDLRLGGEFNQLLKNLNNLTGIKHTWGLLLTAVNLFLTVHELTNDAPRLTSSLDVIAAQMRTSKVREQKRALLRFCDNLLPLTPFLDEKDDADLMTFATLLSRAIGFYWGADGPVVENKECAMLPRSLHACHIQMLIEARWLSSDFDTLVRHNIDTFLSIFKYQCVDCPFLPSDSPSAPNALTFLMGKTERNCHTVVSLLLESPELLKQTVKNIVDFFAHSKGMMSASLNLLSVLHECSSSVPRLYSYQSVSPYWDIIQRWRSSRAITDEVKGVVAVEDVDERDYRAKLRMCVAEVLASVELDPLGVMTSAFKSCNSSLTAFSMFTSRMMIQRSEKSLSEFLTSYRLTVRSFCALDFAHEMLMRSLETSPLTTSSSNSQGWSTWARDPTLLRGIFSAFMEPIEGLLTYLFPLFEEVNERGVLLPKTFSTLHGDLHLSREDLTITELLLPAFCVLERILREHGSVRINNIFLDSMPLDQLGAFTARCLRYLQSRAWQNLPYSRKCIRMLGSLEWTLERLAENISLISERGELREASEDDMCYICRKRLVSVRMKPCGHNFCVYCPGRWKLESQGGSFLCPYCKTVVDSTEFLETQ